MGHFGQIQEGLARVSQVGISSSTLRHIRARREDYQMYQGFSGSPHIGGRPALQAEYEGRGG